MSRLSYVQHEHRYERLQLIPTRNYKHDRAAFLAMTCACGREAVFDFGPRDEMEAKGKYILAQRKARGQPV